MGFHRYGVGFLPVATESDAFPYKVAIDETFLRRRPSSHSYGAETFFLLGLATEWMHFPTAERRAIATA